MTKISNEQHQLTIIPPISSRVLIGYPSRVLGSDVSGPSAGRFYFDPSWFVYPSHEK
jgi:hypothetical protein